VGRTRINSEGGRQGDDFDTAVDRTISGAEISEVRMIVNLSERMRLVLSAAAKPGDTVVTDGAMFLSNKLLTGAEG
jgi:hypothetical protein